MQDGITTDRDKSGFVNSLAPLPRPQVKSLSKVQLWRKNGFAEQTKTTLQITPEELYRR